MDPSTSNSPSARAGRGSPRVPHELEVAVVRAVSVSMGVARAVQRSLVDAGRAGNSVLLKADESPVTVADFAVQAIVTLALHRALGDGLHLIGEESAGALTGDDGIDRDATRTAVVEAVRSAEPELDETAVIDLLALSRAAAPPADADGGHGASRRWWLIDPIDGTKGFLRGDHYCVAVALVDDGAVRFAVLGCPNLDDDPRRALDSHPARGAIFVAHDDGGCTVRSELDPDRIIRPVRRPPAPSESVIRICESVVPGPVTHSRVSSVIDRVAAATGRSTVGMRLDSQCKHALVARDQADVYIRLPRRSLPVESAWDHASGSLVAREGGAWVSDLDGRPLDFSRGPNLDRNRGVLACDASLAPALLDAIRATGAATLPPSTRDGGR